ncbi:hypothetical protein GCM10025881_31070 [Pseudolysinimonas kribbensis]|uniref:EfeO-type cupredoxin-like domain-containing protein n=1 Tax=Pseudolysinimonas kribbensis TaxID=433641 RepID=A0ABQ6K6L3_9MICO|nr:hypothetical protein [Pseudolysinimonas kribbensis]GMA96283.1 hypothetical protein GCM10025881_31070 [Pseudolysinimonas kribbensis]
MRPTKAIVSTAAGIVGLAIALAGCSAATPGGASRSHGAAQVTITLTSGGSGDACMLDASTAAAGPVTFTIKNSSSTAITEVELLSDQRIIGEKENLAPGLKPTSLTLTLGGGTYQVYCPGAEKELQDFRVTGKAASTPAAAPPRCSRRAPRATRGTSRACSPT